MPKVRPRGPISRLFRRSRLVLGAVGHVALLLAGANLLFWVLVAARFAPFQEPYLEGRTVWLGRHVLVFGHGYWERDDGYWQHQTITKLRDGTTFDGPTLDLIARLRHNGAQSIWGSWCYSGDYPYIRKDLVTGSTTPCPSNTSYNRAPGITIPIWVGATFVRLGWPQSEYGRAPDVIEYHPPDTLRMSRPSLQRFVSTFYSIRGASGDLPNPDSLSWEASHGDRLTMSWQEYRSLSWHEKWEERDLEDDTTRSDERTGTVRFWIRGRSFPIHIAVPGEDTWRARSAHGSSAGRAVGW